MNQEKKPFSQNIALLSDKAKATILHTKDLEKAAPSYDKPIGPKSKPSMIFVDIAPSMKFLERYLLEPNVGDYPNSLILIFSYFNIVKEILLEEKLIPVLQEGRLKLWSLSEWREELDKELTDIRSPFLFNESFVLPNNHPIQKGLTLPIKKNLDNYLKSSQETRKEILRYYKSEAFAERIQEILNGAPLRIYVARACSTVAVKRFSDHCAEGFRELGCEVYIHEPCKPGKIDYLIARNIEINRFKPDLFIKSPNAIYNEKYFSIDRGPPTLYSLQDLLPHVDFFAQLKTTPLRKEDLVFFIMHAFANKYKVGKIPENQTICDYLPINSSQRITDPQTENAKYDIGFVKTMKTPISMIEKTPKSVKEKEQIMALEMEILDNFKRGKHFEFLEVLKLGVEPDICNLIFGFLHQLLSLQFINTLAENQFTLSLVGSGWEQFPHLKKFAKGFVDNRDDYFQSFKENKINISINPWIRHHPRVFEGAMSGAFFLIYKVPEEICMQNMAPELTPGVHFDYFSSKHELVEKSRFYLERPELRKEIGENLKKTVLENYTYKTFCSKVLNKFKSNIHSFNQLTV